MFRIRCVCGNSFITDAAHTPARGDEISAYHCERCNTFYVAVIIKAFKLPKLFKLASTKSELREEQENVG